MAAFWTKRRSPWVVLALAAVFWTLLAVLGHSQGRKDREGRPPSPKRDSETGRPPARGSDSGRGLPRDSGNGRFPQREFENGRFPPRDFGGPGMPPPRPFESPTEATVQSKGYLFVDGKYIDPPYEIRFADEFLFINDHKLTCIPPPRGGDSGRGFGPQRPGESPWRQMVE